MSTDETEVEWTVEGFLAECEAMRANPPAAPEGMERIECGAEPPHWPTYVAHVDGMYPSPCPSCQLSDMSRQYAKLRCERDHRRWKSWNGWSRISSRLYTLGITASGGGTSFGGCEFCGIGRQHHPPRWRGKRPYILGVQRDTWTCLLRYHHRRTVLQGSGFCTICLPCPDCGSTATDHFVCGGAV